MFGQMKVCRKAARGSGQVPEGFRLLRSICRDSNILQVMGKQAITLAGRDIKS